MSITHSLTDRGIAQVQAAIDSPSDGSPFECGILTLWRLLEPAWDSLDTVQCTAYVIPKSQWLDLCERFARILPTSESIGRLNYALSFMNYGPSAS